ncbi:hypothetical protein CBS101457_005698 [Exobasidium rhododendri]|nr:hypothetical protein CBS101457_005698 [Exobasidium rhododendri]
MSSNTNPPSGSPTKSLRSRTLDPVTPASSKRKRSNTAPAPAPVAGKGAASSELVVQETSSESSGSQDSELAKSSLASSSDDEDEKSEQEGGDDGATPKASEKSRERAAEVSAPAAAAIPRPDRIVDLAALGNRLEVNVAAPPSLLSSARPLFRIGTKGFVQSLTSRSFVVRALRRQTVLQTPDPLPTHKLILLLKHHGVELVRLMPLSRGEGGHWSWFLEVKSGSEVLLPRPEERLQMWPFVNGSFITALLFERVAPECLTYRTSWILDFAPLGLSLDDLKKALLGLKGNDRAATPLFKEVGKIVLASGNISAGRYTFRAVVNYDYPFSLAEMEGMTLDPVLLCGSRCRIQLVPECTWCDLCVAPGGSRSSHPSGNCPRRREMEALAAKAIRTLEPKALARPKAGPSSKKPKSAAFVKK